MKNLVLILLTFTVVSNSVYAQSCPLTNAKLTDLRVAAMKLSQKVSLSPQCQKFEEQVNEANKKLSDLTSQISEMTKGDFTLDEKQSTAIAAVTSLNNVTAVFNDKTCGQELAGFLDYVEAFADVANGISPFLALYGGPEAMPWAVGTALAGTTVKSLVNFFNSKTVDMRDPEQSTAFIQNSCAFYDLDLIKTSIDDLQMDRYTKMEEELEKMRDQLADLEAKKPAEPSNNFKIRLDEALRDSERLKFLTGSFHSDPLEACVYIQSYANYQDGGLVQRVWENYEESIAKDSFRQKLERDYFLGMLNRDAQNIDFTKCKELGQRWLNKVESMSKAGIAFLEQNTAKEEDFKIFEQWKKEYDQLALNVKTMEAKLKYLQEMFGGGFDIEYSEIIRAHDQVKNAIFLSYKYMVVLKFKGLAEAWLKVKKEDAIIGHRNFYSIKEDAEKKIQNIMKITKASTLDPKYINAWAEAYRKKYNKEHPEVNKGTVVELCNYLRQAWTSWNDGYIHAKAGKSYCQTFDKVINQLEYPAVQQTCFGTTSKVGFQYKSLRNQVKEFEAIKHEADEVLERMNQLSCARPVTDIHEKALALSSLIQ